MSPARAFGALPAVVAAGHVACANEGLAAAREALARLGVED